MHDVDQDFRSFRDRRDPAALARVFDALGPELFVVARHWTGDAGEAEDCVQQAFVRAVEKAESWDGARPVGAWLGGILLGELRNARRRRRAVPEPNGDAADPLAEDPSESAAEAEAAELMARAAESLASPYREVVLLRLRHDLDLVEIAGVLDRPYETVRTQLRRALMMLRRTLPRGLALGGIGVGGVGVGVGGGTLDGARRGALAAAVRGAIAPTLWVAGHAKATLLIGLTLVALLGLGWWAVGARVEDPQVPHDAGAVAVDRAALAAAAAADDPAGSERVAVAAVPDGVIAAVQTSELLPLAGRVVAALDGSPVAGAEVAIAHSDADRFLCFDQDYRDRVERVGAAATDASGAFTVDVDPGRLYRVEVRAAGFSSARFVDRAVGEGQVFELTPAENLSVRVIERGSRMPIVGAWVTARQDRDGPVEHAPTGLDGRAELVDVAPKWIAVTHAGYREALVSDREELAARTVEVVLESDPGDDYVLLDSRTDAPLAHAAVRLARTIDVRYATGDRITTDADGRFRSQWGPGRMQIEIPGYACAPRQEQVGVAPIRLLLDPGATVNGRVIDAQRRPLPNTYVAALAEVHDAVGVSTEWIRGRIDEAGRFTVEGLRPDRTYDLHLRLPGFGARLLRLPPSVAAARTDLGDLILEPAAIVCGRVVGEDGAVRGGEQVYLHGADAKAADLVEGLPVTDVGHYAITATGRRVCTDAVGSFRFPDVAAGNYTLWIPTGPHEQRDHGPYSVASGRVVDIGDVVVSTGRTLSGALLGPDGSLESSAAIALMAVRPGQPRMRQAKIVAGRYTIDGLWDGALFLIADAPPGLALEPMSIGAGTARHDVRLERSLPIEGQVLDRDEKPVRAVVHAFRATPALAFSFGADCDADGRFRLDVDPAFIGRLSAAPRDGHPGQAAGVDDISAGMTDIVIRLP